MKKLALIALLALGISAYAQEGKKDRKGADVERLSPEQRNQLMLKRLTNELDLNDAQQKEIGKIIAQQSEKREKIRAERMAQKEKGTKPTADEKFARENQKLDDQAELKTQLKKVLSPAQYEKWEAMKKEKREHMQERMEKRRAKKTQE